MRLFPDFFFNLVLFYFLFFFENNEQPQLKVLKKLFLSYMVKRAIRFMEFCFYLFILSIKWRKKIINSSTLTMFLNLFQDYLKKIVMKVRDVVMIGRWRLERMMPMGERCQHWKWVGGVKESPFLFSLFFSCLLMAFFHHYNL